MGERVWGSPRVRPLFVYVQRAGPWLGGNGSRIMATTAHHHRSSLTTGERNGTEKQSKAKQKHSNRIYGPAPYCLGDLYNMASTMVSTLDNQSPDPKYHGPLFVINNVSNVFRLSQMSTTFFVSRTPVLPPPKQCAWRPFELCCDEKGRIKINQPRFDDDIYIFDPILVKISDTRVVGFTYHLLAIFISRGG